MRLPFLHGRLLYALAWLFTAMSACPAHAQDAGLETAIKATYLYKFAPFVRWPTAAAAFPGGAFTICVSGDPQVTSLLLQAVAGQQVDSHPISVRGLDSGQGDPGCSILYATGSPGEVAGALRTVHGLPVLTVTDGAGGSDDTGIIAFVVVDGHVRFAIDAAAAAAVGLGISSKLLSLAVHVTQ